MEFIAQEKAREQSELAQEQLHTKNVAKAEVEARRLLGGVELEANLSAQAKLDKLMEKTEGSSGTSGFLKTFKAANNMNIMTGTSKPFKLSQLNMNKIGDTETSEQGVMEIAQQLNKAKMEQRLSSQLADKIKVPKPIVAVQESDDIDVENT